MRRRAAPMCSPWITVASRERGESIGHNRVARMMMESRLQCRQKRRHRVRTTDSRHDEPIAPNQLALTPEPTKPDEVQASDINYVEAPEGRAYLAGVLDLYSRRLIGWAM